MKPHSLGERDANEPEIIRALERRKFQSDMNLLAALDSVHSDAVRRALAAVPGNSKIDIRMLIESARREVAEQAANSPCGEAWRYAITLMSADQLAAFNNGFGGEGFSNHQSTSLSELG